jgi:hypothetical protein
VEAQDAILYGWGPDFTELIAQCPVKECPWEHVWEHQTTLGDVIDVIGTHLHEVHP